MDEKYRQATAKDLLDALRKSGIVKEGPSPKELTLSSIAVALVENPDSDMLNFVQLPGLFVKE
jgi:hypothetical protein